MHNDEIEGLLNLMKDMNEVEIANLAGFLLRKPDFPIDQIIAEEIVKEANTCSSNRWLSENFDTALAAFCQWRQRHSGKVTSKGVLGFISIVSPMLTDPKPALVAIVCLLVDLGADALCPYHQFFEAEGVGSYEQTPPDGYELMPRVNASFAVKYHPGIFSKRVHPNHPHTEHQFAPVKKGFFEASIHFETERTLNHFRAIFLDGTFHELSFESYDGRHFSYSAMARGKCQAEQVGPKHLRIVGECSGLSINKEQVIPLSL